MPFDGLRVLSLESRRAVEIERLIRNQGGVPFVAPSMREVPLAENQAAFAFAQCLFADRFDMVILLTGVGTRFLNQVMETRWPPGSLAEALKKVTVVVRGPKPAAVMREWGVPIAIIAPEPNTWREVLAATEGRPEKRVAVQEYGRTNDELIRGLIARGAEVTQVPVYQWALPKDIEPLREAARRLAKGEIDVVLFTAAIQVEHLLKVTEQIGLTEAVRAAMARAVVGSIGPTTSETLREKHLQVDFEPSHPKMGILINEIAAASGALLKSKREKGPETTAPDDPPSRNTDDLWSLMTRYAPALGLMPASMFAGYLIGYGLDYVFSTMFLRYAFLVLGVVAGIVQLMRILNRDMK